MVPAKASGHTYALLPTRLLRATKTRMFVIYVGFNVEYGGAFQHIQPTNINGRVFDLKHFQNRHADRVGPDGRADAENAHFLGAVRTHTVGRGTYILGFGSAPAAGRTRALARRVSWGDRRTAAEKCRQGVFSETRDRRLKSRFVVSPLSANHGAHHSAGDDQGPVPQKA
jgi:hypothetical protein